MKSIFAIIAVIFLTPLGLSSAFAENNSKRQNFKLSSKPILTFDIAHQMALACINRQKEMNSSPIYISIYDDGANPILLLKMDGAALGAGASAMRKAESSATLPFSSGDVGTWVKNNSSVGHAPGLFGIQGGLPIMSKSGVHLGGVGVSGGSSEDDEKCAQTAIDSVKESLSL